jgi:hypothetical protein
VDLQVVEQIARHDVQDLLEFTAAVREKLKG